jgi:hypothetical protein
MDDPKYTMYATVDLTHSELLHIIINLPSDEYAALRNMLIDKLKNLEVDICHDLGIEPFLVGSSENYKKS